MSPRNPGARLAALLLVATLSCPPMRSAAPVRFLSFTYTGRDPVYGAPLPAGHYRNPVLAGFYPDPDICRVGADYYLINSTFAYFPGIPVFHSRDLVNWTQVGNAIDRPGQLNYAGLGVSRGIFAPALSYHDGIFYVVCTHVDGGGNFVITARDPAGPWSDPAWLGFDGIDPSLFFDGDSAWIVNNGPPPGGRSLYEGHRAIWIQRFDARTLKLLGPRSVIVNGGVRMADHPQWIEGPHLLKEDGWYYLICAEGGTAEGHSEVVFRSRAPDGPFEAGPVNPILTQRDLPGDRPNPVTCTGHADLVMTPEGKWWAVFLGCQPYLPGTYNTGRETFMLPVEWKGGWPVILAQGRPVGLMPASPGGASLAAGPVPHTGNFTWTDDFRGPGLALPWMGLRGLPRFELGRQGLLLAPATRGLESAATPAFLAHRVQHAHFTAETTLEIPPRGVSAGIAVFQNETHYFLWHFADDDGGKAVVLEIDDGTGRRVLSSSPAGQGTATLVVKVDGGHCTFSVKTRGHRSRGYAREGGYDATILSTRAAGGFVGSVVGPCARLTP
ncbi:MAG TPA: family 43 glycosylhydrolase [Opitutaceae bacterium]|jgi:alpha-N-arabinofuranosidase